MDEFNLPETDDEIDAFIEETKKNPPPPINTAKLVARHVVEKARLEKRIVELETEVSRLHGLWQAAEQRTNPMLRNRARPKIIQVVVPPDNQKYQGVLLGLGDDGVVYYQNPDNGRWSECVEPLTGKEGEAQQ